MAAKWALLCAVPSSVASRSVALITRLGTHNQLLARQWAWSTVREHQRPQPRISIPEGRSQIARITSQITAGWHSNVYLDSCTAAILVLETNRNRRGFKDRNELNRNFDLLNYVRIIELELQQNKDKNRSLMCQLCYLYIIVRFIVSILTQYFHLYCCFIVFSSINKYSYKKRNDF